MWDDGVYNQGENKNKELVTMENTNEETKRDRFVRVAEARTNKIIDMIQLLGNCANVNNYEYTQQDVEKIFNAIETELREAKKKFNKPETKKNTRFTLR